MSRLVILDASVFDTSSEKQTYRQTAVKTVPRDGTPRLPSPWVMLMLILALILLLVTRAGDD